jgi:hypothetical protein
MQQHVVVNVELLGGEGDEITDDNPGCVDLERKYDLFQWHTCRKTSFTSHINVAGK